MHRKLLVTLTATATAVSMMVAPCITAFAEDQTHAEASAGQTVNVDGNVTSTDGHTAVVATGEDATVNVDGNVAESGQQTNTTSAGEQKWGQSAVAAYNGGAVNVTGSVSSTDGGGAVNINGQNTSVEIKGDVTASGQNDRTSTYPGASTPQTSQDVTGNTAVQAYDGASVTVGGNLNATDGAGGVSANSNASVNVKGDINASGQGTSEHKVGESTTDSKREANAVSANTGSTVTVGGNVTTTDGGSAVYASGKDATIKVDGNVSTSGKNSIKDSSGYTSEGAYGAVQSQSGAKVEIKGDVTQKDGGTAVQVSGSEGTASVTVGGNVDASGSSVKTDAEGKVTYSGAVGVRASSGTADVAGNVTGASNGVNSTGDSQVTVGGNVTATGVDNTVYGWNEKTQKYDIPKNTVSGDGVYSRGDSKITVKGDVSGVTDGLLINPNNDNKSSTIVVVGTISASGKGGDGIQISKVDAAHGGIDYKDVKDFLDDVPTLVIGGINADDPVTAYASIEGKDARTASEEIKKAVIESINYIIKVDEESKNKFDVTVKGDNVKKIEGYDTVNIEKAFQVAAKLPDGYRLEGGENVSVTQNSDGTFTLILKNVKGGINVKAVLIPVENPSTGETEYNVVAESTPSQPSTPPAGAIVVTPVATPVTTPAAGGAQSANGGNKPALNVVMDLGKITPTQYQAAVIQNIAAAPANGALNIETDRVSFLDSKMIDAIAAKNNIDVNIVFMYNGRKIKVTIPAGYNVRSLLDSNGYCGFLKLLSVFGEADKK